MADPDAREFAVSIAERAAETLTGYFRRLDPGAISAKSRSHDLVTEADHAAERVILDAIRDAFPDHSILAEETGRSGRRGESPFEWIVDPLDGTVNFVHGFPFFAVSIALYESGEPLLGVISAPALSELFVAERGKGATLNGEPLRVSGTARLADAFLTTGFAYEREDSPNQNIHNLARVIYKSRAIRRPGSACLDLAYVAAGRFDGFWEAHLNAWDVAAGGLLVREAGGRTTDFFGGETWISGLNILATNGAIHDELGSCLVFDPSLEEATDP